MKRILSLGAGIQSSTILLMSANGELPKLDCAIFADTQFEPATVYRNLEFLIGYAGERGIPVYVRSKSSIKEDSLASRVRPGIGGRRASMPWFVDSGSRSGGKIRRQCTKEYKLEVIDRFCRREILGLLPRQRAPRHPVIEQWIGISADEAHRIKPSGGAYVMNQYPLVGYPVEMLPLTMRRQDCKEWLRRNFPGRSFPRSACIGCPYRSDAEWRQMRRDAPKDWEAAMEFDAKIRKVDGIRGDTYTHRSLKPLNRAVGGSAPSLFGEECDGVCDV